MMIQSQEQILLVISDSQVTFLLERVLRSMGYAIKAVEDRAGALKAMDLLYPSLVILGEKIGGSSGIELAAEMVRRSPSTPGTR